MMHSAFIQSNPYFLFIIFGIIIGSIGKFILDVAQFENIFILLNGLDKFVESIHSNESRKEAKNDSNNDMIPGDHVDTDSTSDKAHKNGQNQRNDHADNIRRNLVICDLLDDLSDDIRAQSDEKQSNHKKCDQNRNV